MIITKLARVESELQGILRLQAMNLRRNLDAAEATQEGFLIAEYGLDYLRQMNESQPSVVSLDGDQVVGYALAATQAIRQGNPLLSDLFHQIDQLAFQGESLKGVNYVVVGQVCVAKGYRGVGLVRQLYSCFREAMQDRYRFAITDVARLNRRSLEAHRKTGFQTIHSIEFEGLEWDVLLWDWSDPLQAGLRG